MREVQADQIEAIRQRLRQVDLRAIALQAVEDARADEDPPQALAMLPAMLGREIDDPTAFAHFLDRLIEQADPDRNILWGWTVKAGAALSTPVAATVVSVVAGAIIIDYVLYKELGDGSGYGPGSGYGAAYDQFKAAMR